jgi:alanine racemase
MTHLAAADTPDHPLNWLQMAGVETLKSLFSATPLSVLNSAGLMSRRFPAHHLTRPGIALYGGEAVAGLPPLAPVVRLDARILQVRSVEAGATVGYGGAQTLRRDSRIAIVAAGYADGYHRFAGSSDARPGARARLSGRDCPLVGRVSMDLIAIDVTDCPPDAAARGGWMTLIGDGISVDDVARHAGTIGYEVLTSLSPRAVRQIV